MKIEINLSKCKLNGLRPDHYVILYILYYGEKKLAKDLFSLKYAIELRNDLIDTKYILDKTPGKTFFDTVISTDHVAKLLDIRSDKINFIEFYNAYPMKVGTRMLRASNVDTVQGRKHQKKYLDRVKTIESHKEAVAAVEAYVRKKRLSSELQFLPMMETVLNNSLWEQWTVFIEAYGSEGASINVDSI
jgi:hypothetical protein